MIRVPEETEVLPESLRREWLETNGLGGFASSTLTGLNTRRYHALLVAAAEPPTRRFVLLSKLEETLVDGARRWELGTNEYPGTIHPRGFRHLADFRPDPLPTFVFEAGGRRIEKKVALIQGEDAVVVRYRVAGGAAAGLALELRPLVAFRDIHALTHANPALDPTVVSGEGWLRVAPYAGLPALYLNHAGAEILEGAWWYYRFQYAEERARGLDCEEDLFSPCGLRFDLERGEAAVVASTAPCDARRAAALCEAEAERRRVLVRGWEGTDPLVGRLVRAADAFLVRRGDRLRTVLAGYPWFADWGRDAMIALPGLALVTGRFTEARAVLLAFARSADRGLIPNRFAEDSGVPEYNSVDATLWFIHAAGALLERDPDGGAEEAREIYGAMVASIGHHVEGTRHGIHVDRDGLLSSGEPGLQLTWMDARVGGRVVTPRAGKPVEVQALWYNALRIVEALAGGSGDAQLAARCGRLARRAARSFNRIFWNPAAGCLFDCIDGDARDASMRPNQLLAVSLPHSMLSTRRMRAVVDAVSSELLTPFGLRTLSPRDPAYQGRCAGDAARRDAAYHQGTVWPWLLGPYVTARLRARGRSAAEIAAARGLLEPFRAHLDEAGIGSVSEIFDGDPPHAPRGCIAQAWSVGELLRAAVDELGMGAPEGRGEPIEPGRSR